MRNLETLSAQILECLHSYPETRDSDKVLTRRIVSGYYEHYNLMNLPFDPQSIGRIRRDLQKKDRDSGENKIQPSPKVKEDHEKKELLSQAEYRQPRHFDRNGNPTLFPPFMPTYEQS